MATPSIRILHTADWHIGKTLYQRNRYEEFQAFLEWLLETIQSERIDALILAGDVFDTCTPSNRAQNLYYNFLGRLAASSCRHVVVTAGNHDSPSFLDAPKSILKQFQIHVVGDIPENIQDEVILLRDKDGHPELIVCAVPYLRDRDVRTSEAGESLETKEEKLREGIQQHYAQVAQAALQLRDSLSKPVPIIAMGHLFTAGGETIAGDGVRNLYVGSLAHVESKIFPPCFDYVALGHLHVPQRVGGSDTIRFSGSPIPMGFGEATQQKYVNIVEWVQGKPLVTMLPIPSFQSLRSIQGDWPHIESAIRELQQSEQSIWLEVSYQGTEPIPNLRERVETLVQGTRLEPLRVSNTQSAMAILSGTNTGESLEDLQPTDVFRKCLEIKQVPEEQWPILEACFREIQVRLDEADTAIANEESLGENP